MSEGNVCGRCRAYLHDGQPNGVLCPTCLSMVARETQHRIREQFLDAIAARVARQSQRRPELEQMLAEVAATVPLEVKA